MAFDGTQLDFETEENLPEPEFERKPIPANTKANVKVRAEKDRELGDFRNGESQFGPWMIIPFEVAEGEYQGEWASMIINLKTTDRRFRKVFEVVTGIDVAKGGSVSFDDFKQKLLSGVFEAELGPESKKNSETGKREETGYTKVFKLEQRVGDLAGDFALAGEGDTEAPGIDEVMGEDDDIPF